MSADPSLQDHLARVETMLHEVEETADPAVRSRTREIVQGVLDLHAAGLERVMQLVGPAAEALARDDLVGSLLLLYGLNPLSLEERVRLALDQVRAMLHKYGGDVELLDVTADGTVRLRLRGGHGCHSPGRAVVEQIVLARAPDLATLEIEEPPTGAFVPVEELVLRNDRVPAGVT